jgi:hypothetical protein
VQFLAGFEADSFSWGYADFGSSAGIATDAGFAGADAEDAESAKFDSFACGQSLLESFEDGVNCGFCLCARQAGALDHVMDDVLFNQWGNLASATDMTLLPLTVEMLQILARIWNSRMALWLFFSWGM